MENFIGVWWSGSENNVLPAGDKATGYKALAFHAVNSDFPIFDDIQKFVVDRGKAAGAGDQIGTVLYNRGMYNAMLITEAARTAQAIAGKSNISQADMIKGFEALEMTEEKMAALGLPGFGPSFSVSCENHGGDGMVAVAQWDAGAGKWSIVSDFQASDMSVIQPLIDADSGAFASENNLSPNCN